jgi:hypothetical protein
MKKLFLASIALLSIFLFSACSSDDSVAKRVEGTHIVRCHASVLTPSVASGSFKRDVKLEVKAEADNFIKIVIPTVGHPHNGIEMVVPEFSISGVPVVEGLENGVEILKHSFRIEGEKNIEGTIVGTFYENGEVEVVVEYMYGNMPFPIKQTLENRDTGRV